MTAQPAHDVEAKTREWYASYHGQKGRRRNDLLQDAGVLFQTIAFEVSAYRALMRAKLAPDAVNVLDVGSGSGGSLSTLLRLGVPSRSLYGIDVLPERITEGRERLPGVHFDLGDAADMPYRTGQFDLVMESTMFVQITDEDLARRIAREMIRVTRKDGHILLIDWRYSGGRKGYAGLSRRRAARLFEVGRATAEVGRFPGALVPPVGRFLSKYASWLYFPVSRLLPAAVGQQAILLRKVEP